MPRLFTALEIPAAMADELALLRGGLQGARWIDKDNYHITLRFIGDVDERTANEVADALDTINRQRFEVSLAGLDVFGGDRPRSIFVPVKSNPALNELHAEQERMMRRLGLPAEPRKFTPHVTLARLTREAYPRAVADYLAIRAFWMPRTFTAARFVLFSSKDSVGGGPYILEEDYPLRAPRVLEEARAAGH